VKEQGFTLIELLVTVAMFAILTSIAAPSFKEFTIQQRLRAASFDLRTDLVLARSEALKRNQNVTIRPRQTGWQTGWVVLVDSSAQELRARNQVGFGVSMSSPASAITFDGSGRVASPAGFVRIGLSASAGSLELDRCMVLDPSGMPIARAEACS
jgi:type IV fimbrial biogenesis protein FimT